MGLHQGEVGKKWVGRKGTSQSSTAFFLLPTYLPISITLYKRGEGGINGPVLGGR